MLKNFAGIIATTITISIITPTMASGRTYDLIKDDEVFLISSSDSEMNAKNLASEIVVSYSEGKNGNHEIYTYTIKRGTYLFAQICGMILSE